MDLTELRILGLSNGEIAVYSALLAIRVSSINKIHEKTGFERRAIYDILNKLLEKGLVSYTIEQGKKTYQLAPARLLEKTNEAAKQLRTLEEKYPKIIEMYDSLKPEIRAEVYRGKEGIKAVFEDMLNFKKNYFIGAGYYIVKELPYFWPHFNNRRIKLGVKWLNLARYELRSEKIPDKNLMTVKFLPKEFSGNPCVIFIYGNKVVNVLWTNQFFAFSIESKEIAENYVRYFNFLWKTIAVS